MRARAAVAVARRPDGRDHLTTLRSHPPLTLRPTPTGLHLVGTSAGPLGGDDLQLDVSVGPGAELTVRSAAAVLVQPGARPGPSVQRIDVRVGAGGRLVWRPEPTVLVRGCDHECHVHLDLEPGATLVWREVVVLGRHGEDSGSLLTRLVVDRAGRPLLRNDLAVGPRWPGSQGPAGVGSATRAVGTALLVGGPVGPPTPWPADVRAAVLPLADEVALVTALAPTAGAVAAALDDPALHAIGPCRSETP